MASKALKLNASTAWLCLAGALSALLWSFWIGNIEYVQARGGVAALVTSQTLCIVGAVFVVRRLTWWRRFVLLLALGQIASSLSDWIFAIMLDPIRAQHAIERIIATPFSARTFLILFGSGILLGGLQAIFADATWRYGFLRKQRA